MAIRKGRVATFEVSTNGTTYYNLGQRKSGNYSLDIDMMDASNCDTEGKQQIYGDEQCKLSLSAMYDPADSAQEILLQAAENKTDIYARVRLVVGSGERQLTFTAQVSSVGVDASHGNVQELTAEVISNGTITRGVQ
jgi:hypothetical protein